MSNEREWRRCRQTYADPISGYWEDKGTDMIEYAAYLDLQSQLSAKEAEIAELSKNCISLSLHESRVWALEEQLAKSDLEVVKLREAIGIANAAISVAANRKECKGWSCCSSCGPIYECEEAQEKIKLLIEGDNI